MSWFGRLKKFYDDVRDEMSESSRGYAGYTRGRSRRSRVNEEVRDRYDRRMSEFDDADGKYGSFDGTKRRYNYSAGYRQGYRDGRDDADAEDE